MITDTTLLDSIVSEIASTPIDWDVPELDGDVRGEKYIDADFGDLHLILRAYFSGYQVPNYIDGFLESVDYEIEYFNECEIEECWRYSDENECEIDLQYIEKKLGSLYN